MSTIENPPAFPTIGSVAYNSDWQTEDGMTLRDWFAGKAPVTLFDAAIACGWSGLEAANMGQDSYRATLWAVMTLMRYEYADAMLAERSVSAAEPKMQHVAYFDEGEFHWMSGIKPRDCELYARSTFNDADNQREEGR